MLFQDPVIRRNSDVRLDNAIVILDEAHNVEDACRDAASFSFTEHELCQAMDDFKDHGR
jgi:Fanconi anemia group J protein